MGVIEVRTEAIEGRKGVIEGMRLGNEGNSPQPQL